MKEYTDNNVEIIYQHINQLKPYKNNARKHSAKQIQQIANSITKFGFINPLVTNDEGELIAGHGRFEAAKLLNLPKVPVIKASHLSETQIKAYRITDNKLSDNSEFDYDLLRIELSELLELEEIDIEDTGFEMAEIDIIIDGDENPSKLDPADDVPEIDNSPAITKPGDKYALGNHILVCGDSTKEEFYQELMGDTVADIVVTDSPYNCPIQGHVGGSGKIRHREFAQASGEMTDPEFENFIKSYMKLTAKFSKDGSIHYHFIDWRGIAM